MSWFLPLLPKPDLIIDQMGLGGDIRCVRGEMV